MHLHYSLPSKLSPAIIEALRIGADSLLLASLAPRLHGPYHFHCVHLSSDYFRVSATLAPKMRLHCQRPLSIVRVEIQPRVAAAAGGAVGSTAATRAGIDTLFQLEQAVSRLLIARR